jgi:hypothetical protein
LSGRAIENGRQTVQHDTPGSVIADAAHLKPNQFDPQPQPQVSLFAAHKTPSPAATGQTEVRLWK